METKLGIPSRLRRVADLGLHRISGRFWRAVATDRVGQVLDAPGPDSAGRYHRPGQPALYITPHADWATIAIGRYLLADGVERAFAAGAMTQ